MKKTIVLVHRTESLTPYSQEQLQSFYDTGARLISVNQTSIDWMYIFEKEVTVQ